MTIGIAKDLYHIFVIKILSHYWLMLAYVTMPFLSGNTYIYLCLEIHKSLNCNNIYRHCRPKVFPKKAGFRNVAKLRGKHLCWSVTWIKFEAVEACNYIKQRVWYRWFYHSFTKIFQKSFYTGHILKYWSITTSLLLIITKILTVFKTV